jgi:hypothetical protein
MRPREAWRSALAGLALILGEGMHLSTPGSLAASSSQLLNCSFLLQQTASQIQKVLEIQPVQCY